MGYYPRKDEKGIKILIPSFLTFVCSKNSIGDTEIKPLYTLTEEEKKIYRDKNDDRIVYHDKKLSNFTVGTVFDARQTTMPMDSIDEIMNPVLEEPRAKGITDIFIKAIYKDGFKVKYDKLETGAKGYCDFENNTLMIQRDLNDLMRLKVIIHEYAHALAHKHLKENNKEYRDHREQYETEAESIAYVVSKYLGLDTGEYSRMYLYSWSKDKDFKEIDDSFTTIINYSKNIIRNYEKMFNENYEIDIKKLDGVSI